MNNVFVLMVMVEKVILGEPDSSYEKSIVGIFSTLEVANRHLEKYRKSLIEKDIDKFYHPYVISYELDNHDYIDSLIINQW